MAAIFVAVRARRFVSAVADHAYWSTSVCIIVAKLAKFRVQTAIRSNERMLAMLEGMVVFVAVEAKPPVFLGGRQREVKGGRSKWEGRLFQTRQ